MLGRCSDHILDPILRRSAAEDRELVRVAVPVYIAGLPFLLLMLALYPAVESFWHLSLLLMTAAVVLSLVMTWFGVRQEVLVRLMLAVMTVSVILSDLSNSYTLETRTWSFSILALDLALATRMGSGVTTLILAAMLSYMVVERLELQLSVGLYEFTQFGESVIPPPCDCGDPPCTTGGVLVMVGHLAGPTVVLLLDFYVTRKFADDMHGQLTVVQASVRVSEQLTAGLSRYDVGRAEALLDSADGEMLPADLRQSYRRLIENLTSYKPYIPEFLLMDTDGSESFGSPRLNVPRPGQSGNSICVCFTDIQSSTDLWEAFPQAMGETLRRHNHAIRSVAAEHLGYEVKTIGDAFMLAFDRCLNGVSFGLDAQERLTAVDWPVDLVRHELCRRVEGKNADVPLWHGPRVRIGMNCGDVHAELNPITGRYDFLGPAVNVAARVETVLRQGGLTGTTKAVLDELGEDGLEQLGSPVVVPLGERFLKGVREGVYVYALFTPALAERQSILKDSAGDEQRSNPLYDPLLPTPLTASMLSYSRSVFSDTAAPPDSPRTLPRLGLHIRSRVVTCTTVRVAHCHTSAVDTLQQLFAAVEYMADVTHGAVVDVLSAHCVVHWNGQQACPDHLSQCHRFIASVQRFDLCRVSAGAATASAWVGNISAGRRRFATVIGPCAELSAALAEEAELWGDGCLACGAVAEHCACLQSAHRAQLWISPRGARMVVWGIECTDTRDLDGDYDKWVSVIPPQLGVEQKLLLDGVFARYAENRDATEVLELVGSGRGQGLERTLARGASVRMRRSPLVIDGAAPGASDSSATVATVPSLASHHPSSPRTGASEGTPCNMPVFARLTMVTPPRSAPMSPPDF